MVVEITKKEKEKIIKHMKLLISQIERDEGEKITHNSIYRIESKIRERFRIILQEEFLEVGERDVKKEIQKINESEVICCNCGNKMHNTISLDFIKKYGTNLKEQILLLRERIRRYTSWHYANNEDFDKIRELVNQINVEDL